MGSILSAIAADPTSWAALSFILYHGYGVSLNPAIVPYFTANGVTKPVFGDESDDWGSSVVEGSSVPMGNWDWYDASAKAAIAFNDMNYGVRRFGRFGAIQNSQTAVFEINAQSNSSITPSQVYYVR